MSDDEIISKYKKYEPFFSNWYIKRFIGEGGFAKVFEIVRNDFGNEYISALKIITVSKTKTEMDSMRAEGMSDADIRETLKGIVEDTVREIQLMYKVRGSGNIVGYEDHEVVEHENGLGWDIFIKMEYLTTLTGHIREQKGQIAKREIIKLGIDICHALEACQKYNIIHRDIKADNIFISENGDFKLGDFGIARIIERKDMELSKKGTSSYMAPEMYKGQPYSSAVDIYSLGMVMYRLMNNNRAPFLPVYPKPVSLDDRDRGLMMRMSGEKFPEPNQMSHNRLTEIVMKACAYRPEDRYSSPMFMRQELEGILYDPEEVTNEDLILIYEDQGTTESTSYSQTGPAEIHIEDGATEVLREDISDIQSNTAVMKEEVKVLCRNCGSAITHDAAFCPVCGATQREKQSEKQRKKGFKKVWIIVGVCAVLLLTIIGLAAALLLSDDDSDTQESTTTESTTKDTTDSTVKVTEETGTSWLAEQNLKITPQGAFTYTAGSADGISSSVSIMESTSGVEEGYKKVTFKFLYSLKDEPAKAWRQYTRVLDRYTGTFFHTYESGSVGQKTFETIQYEGKSYEVFVEYEYSESYLGPKSGTCEMAVYTVTCSKDYDGAVCALGSSLEIDDSYYYFTVGDE